MDERLDIDEHYSVSVKINPNVCPPRPTYDAEISFTLLDKKKNTEVFHISNHHWHPTDKLRIRLGGNPSTKINENNRRIYINIGDSFNALKTNFIDKCCSRIGEDYRERIVKIMNKVKLS
jgi:hypothetical protein